MNTANTANACLPAAISLPTAWAAFDEVSQFSWDVVINIIDEVPEVEFSAPPEFDQILQGLSSWHYSDQAKAWVAMRIMEVADATHGSILRQYAQLPSVEGEGRFRLYLRNQIRREIEERFSVDEWFKSMIECLAVVDPANRGRIEKYVGADLLVPLRSAQKAINYVFSRCGARVDVYGGKFVLLGGHNMQTVRRFAGTAERDVANHLVVSAVDAALGKLDPEVTATDEVLATIESELRETLERYGVWGLVHRVLPLRREKLKLDEVSLHDDDHFGELFERQEARISMEVSAR